MGKANSDQMQLDMASFGIFDDMTSGRSYLEAHDKCSRLVVRIFSYVRQEEGFWTGDDWGRVRELAVGSSKS